MWYEYVDNSMQLSLNLPISSNAIYPQENGEWSLKFDWCQFCGPKTWIGMTKTVHINYYNLKIQDSSVALVHFRWDKMQINQYVMS